LIPLVDLKAQHSSIADEITEAVAGVMSRSDFILGHDVELFEQEYAAFSEVKHCIGVASGTDALDVALRAAGVGAGDDVVLPANSFIASAIGVIRAGANPVLVDVDPVNHLMDPERLLDAITPSTKAIMPVHLYGQICAMEEVSKVAADAGVLVVEDAAQTQGASQNGMSAGNFGLVAGTSFYPGKNLGAYGDAGAVLTNSDEIASKARLLRNYGSEVKYEHSEFGFNSRLDTIQAAILRVKLRRLEDWNEARRQAARRYEDLLSDEELVVLPRVAEGNEHIWHLYVIRVPRRDEILKRLHASGIGAGIHYPIPIHLQRSMKSLGYSEGDFPVTEKAAKEILSLPLFPEITPEQQEQVAEELKRTLGEET
jgi:dTDP-4-amino-4,6-dideoxygalactose transaminase